MMTRLKSMYLLLGGDMHELQKGNLFERLFKNTDANKKEKVSKALRRFSSGPSKMNDKILSIRYQLEDLRILCDLVKRR